MARKDGKQGRIKQIRETYRLTKKNDPRLPLVLAGVFFGVLAIFVIASLLLNALTWLAPLGIGFGFLAMTLVFGRRAEKSAYAQIEGQPGAAAAVLKTLRSGWFVTPGVAITKNQDIVHRVIGRPGVILVGEGSSTRVAHLIANERKREARFVPETPFTEIIVGDGEGEVSLRKLNRAVQKLPRALKPADVTEVRRRMEALSSQPLPVPKGPLPKSTRAARGGTR